MGTMFKKKYKELLLICGLVFVIVSVAAWTLMNLRQNRPKSLFESTYTLRLPPESQKNSSYNTYFNTELAVHLLTKVCPNSPELVSQLTGAISSRKLLYDRVVLIVVFFSPEFEDNINLIELIYRVNFPHIVYCHQQGATPINETIPFVEYDEDTYYTDHVDNNGLMFYQCVNKVMQDPTYTNNINVLDGYLLISDDLLLLHWNIDFITHRDEIWFHGLELNFFDLDTKCHTEEVDEKLDAYNCETSSWGPWRSEQFIANAKALLQHLKKFPNSKNYQKCYESLKQKYGGSNRLGYKFRIADMFYIPSKAEERYLEISEVFLKFRMIHALAVPNIRTCLADVAAYYSLTGSNDIPVRKLLKSSPQTVLAKAAKSRLSHLHPVKLSGVVYGDELQTKFFCDGVLPLYYGTHSNITDLQR